MKMVSYTQSYEKNKSFFEKRKTVLTTNILE